MAITGHWYTNAPMKVMGGAVDLDTDTIKLSLHTSTYVPNQDTHIFFNSATNELATANGYTAGGVTLGSVTLTADATSNESRFDCADPTWTFTSSVTWRYGVIRKARGGASSADELIAYLDWGADQTVSGTYTITIDPAGLLYITAA